MKLAGSVTTRSFTVGFGLVVFMLFWGLGSATAFSTLHDGRSTCTSDRCRSVDVRGTYAHYRDDNRTNSVPASYHVYTSGGECLRIEVVSQDSDLDLEATLVCPDGTVWRDDDDAGDLRPLIKALTPSNAGFCTVLFSSFDGNGPEGDRNFRFKYGRYPEDNPNCTDPSVTLN